MGQAVRYPQLSVMHKVPTIFPKYLIAAQVQAYLTKGYTEVSCAQFPQMPIKQPP